MAKGKKSSLKKVKKKDNKNLITIVLLIIAGIVILSYTNNIGNVAKGDLAEITITPKEVRQGTSTITINVDNGFYGVRKSYYILDPNERVKVQDNFCNTNIYCKGDLEERFGIYSSWGPGTYYVKVYDISREKAGMEPWVITPFRII